MQNVWLNWRGGRSLALAVIALLVVTKEVLASSPFVIQEKHRDLVLGALALSAESKLDITPLDGRSAIERIKQAIDILYRKSPFSAQAIETLRGAGQIVIVYDPQFPKSRFSGLTIAAFFPDFYQPNGPSKQFVTVVGRYGAKWPAIELAAVLAHELVGHGMQHYRGRLEHVRTVDLECEAYLYQEQAYQDLGVDKGSREMIRFRQTLEDHWCKSFRADTRLRHPAKMALWEHLNPDVPAILRVYLRYVDRLRENGAARKAIDIERREGMRR